VRLRFLRQPLVIALTSADLRREIVPGLLHLCRLSLSRRVRLQIRLQNRFSARITQPGPPTAGIKLDSAGILRIPYILRA